MKRIAPIALMTSLFLPSLSFADAGHPMVFEAHEVLHYFTSFHHLLPTALAIGIGFGMTLGVRRLLTRRKQSIR